MAPRRETSFGTLLKAYREAAGLTQEDLAEAAGVSVDAISTLERGVRRAPRADTMRLLVRALSLEATEQTALEAAVHRRRGPSARSAAPHDQVAPRSGQPHAGQPVPPLVGRHHEQRILAQSLGGEGPPLLIFAGEPGIGKSRLLHEAATRGAAQGWHVLQGGCQRQGGQEPYAPVLEALAGYMRRQAPAQLRRALAGCAWLVRLLPELADDPRVGASLMGALPSWTLPPAQEWRLIVGAVRCFLGQVAGPAGTLLVLDDLQWAGADALDLLTTLVRAAAELPLRVVGAYRDTEMAPDSPLSTMLADLAHAGLARQVTLAPLAQGEAVALLAGLLEGAAGAPAAERVVQRTGGVPFFVVSYALALRETPRTDAGEGVPWDLAQGLRGRVAALPTAAQEVLRAAAVIGRVAPYALLEEVVELPKPEVLAGLEAASRARLMVGMVGQPAAQFAHDVIREALEADVPLVRRVPLHRRIGAALEKLAEVTGDEPPVEALAYHYGRGGDSAREAFYLEQAGDRAGARFANTAAVRSYRVARERLDALARAADAARVGEKLASVLQTSARYESALAVWETTAEAYQHQGDWEGWGRAAAAIGLVFSHWGWWEEAARRVEAAVAQLQGASAGEAPGRALAALYQMSANISWYLGRYEAGLGAAQRAADLARATGASALLAATLEMHASLLLMLVGRAAEALVILQEAAQVAEAAGDIGTLCWVFDDLAVIHERRGDWAASRHYRQRSQALAEQRQDPFQLMIQAHAQGMLAIYTGDWVQARHWLDHAATMQNEIGTSWYTPVGLAGRAHLALIEGDWAQARSHAEAALAQAPQPGNLFVWRLCGALLAELDLLDDRPHAALDRLLPLRDRPGVMERDATLLLTLLAWAYLEVSDLVAARQAIDHARRRLREDGLRRDLGDVLRVMALVELAQGRWRTAARTLDEGLEVTRGLPYPYAEARLLHTWGLLHLHRNDLAPARARLEAALAIFRRLGARKHVEETEQALNALTSASEGG